MVPSVFGFRVPILTYRLFLACPYMLDLWEIGVEWGRGIFTTPPIFNIYDSKKVKTISYALFICEIFDV
jgi:hypothetical protein